jgi:hypothetical protein
MIGTGICPQTPPRTGFLQRRVILRTVATIPCRSSGCDPPPSCVASGLKLKAHMAGDNERAPWPSAASRLSAASSHTLVPPLIRPYPSSPKNIPQTSFPSGRESICEYLVAEKTYRTGRAGDPCVGVRILCFSKPSVLGFPTTDDPADRKCRYLVQPPTLPSMARLRGYQRPPRRENTQDFGALCVPSFKIGVESVFLFLKLVHVNRLLSRGVHNTAI